jgi:steroid Delta-isomerase
MAASAAPRHADARVARIVERFEQLTPGDVARLAEIYTDDVRFKDPFNEVEGLAAVQRIFAHMFEALDAPRFVVHDIVVEREQCFLTWDFVFRLRRFDRQALQTVRGSSHLRLADDGRIAVHRDYWDAAEELYEKLPLLGTLMRWLRRRANR